MGGRVEGKGAATSVWLAIGCSDAERVLSFKSTPVTHGLGIYTNLCGQNCAYFCS